MNSVNTIKEQQRSTWDSVAAGWYKHDAYLQKYVAPVSERLLDAARLVDGYHVLDIACGTGEPAIPAAKRVGALGRVVATDLVEAMVEFARKKAASQKVPNIEFHCLDGEMISFEKKSFDAVISRWGLMFMPDPLACLRKAHEVLRDGRRIALSCWADPAKNPSISLMTKALANYMEVPKPEPGAPGIFAFSDGTRLEETLKHAGFKDVSVEEFQLTMMEIENGEAYFQLMIDIAGPISVMANRLSASDRQSFARDVANAAEAFREGSMIRFRGVTWIASATK